MDADMQDQASRATAGTAAHGEHLAYLEQALWKQLADSATPTAFARAWITLQCAMIPGVRRGLVLLGQQDTGRISARWPEMDEEDTGDLLGAAELALKKQRGVLKPCDQDPQWCFVAYPLEIEQQFSGVIALEVEKRAPGDLKAVMRQLQWGSAWLELQSRRGAPMAAAAPRQRLVTVIQLVATCLEQSDFQPAATAVATEAAGSLSCSRVSIGFLNGRHAEVEAVSHSAQFGKKANLIRAISNAMDESIDLAEPVVYPPPVGRAEGLLQAHEKLARDSHCAICTVPFGSNGELLGAMTFERGADEPFDAASIQTCQHLTAILGPILAVQRKDDRWIGVKIAESFRRQLHRFVSVEYPGRKLAALLLVLIVGTFSYVDATYRVSADAVLEGAVQMVVAAPRNGYIADAPVRAGDIVAEGELMVTLDDKDLQLERLKWQSQKNQLERQRRDALAQHEKAQSRILKAQIDQADAELALIALELDKTTMRAPFDGIVVSGDLSQSLGAPVERGQVLMEVTPLEQYRVVLEVDERDIAQVAEGQSGELVLPSMPGQGFAFVLEKITPVAAADEGKNTFRVEGALLDQTANLRPGMQGAGKVEVGERKLIWIWTHRFTEWLRIWVWSWWY